MTKTARKQAEKALKQAKNAEKARILSGAKYVKLNNFTFILSKI